MTINLTCYAVDLKKETLSPIRPIRAPFAHRALPILHVCNNHYYPEQRTVQLTTKRSRLPWLIIGGIILLVILIAALFLFSPSPQPIPIPSPAIISSTDFVAPTTAPQPPSCTVAINGQKVWQSDGQTRCRYRVTY